MAPASFLITGATGKQGRSTILAILAHPSFSESEHTIYALTRDASSASAQKLQAKSPAIKLVTGNLDEPAGIFKSLPSPPTGVFSVQALGKDEVKQGVGLVDAAAEAGVGRFVQSSVARGGEGPTDVPHFRTKWEIEQHLEKKAAEKGFDYAILRPVFFLDNLNMGYFGKVAFTAWRDKLGPDQKLQVVDTNDIGYWAAEALLGSPAMKNRKVEIAGDELTFAEADAVFKRETGQPLPTTFGWIASLLLLVVSDLGKMYQFFREKGFNVDIAALRQEGRVTDFATFLQNSNFAKKSS